jgi:hypothetical protein
MLVPAVQAGGPVGATLPPPPEPISVSGDVARAQIATWIKAAVPAVAGALGFVGFVSVLGGAIVFCQYYAAQLPATRAVATLPRGDVLAAGGVTLALYLALGLLAVFVVHLLQSAVVEVEGGTRSEDDIEELERRLAAARARLASLECDLAAVGQRPHTARANGGPAATLTTVPVDLLEPPRENEPDPNDIELQRLCSETLEEVVSIEQKLVRAPRRHFGAPNVGNQLGLICVLLVEVSVVVALTHRSMLSKLWVSAVLAIAAFAFVLGGRAWAPTSESGTRALLDKETLWAQQSSKRLIQAIAILLAAAIILHWTDVWTAIPITVAFVLATVTLAIGRLHPRRFFWYGCAIFVSVGVFGAALAIDRTFRNPSLEPATVLLKNGESLSAYYIADTSSRLYLATVALKPLKRDKQGRVISYSNDPIAGSGRLFWLSNSDVQGYAVGPLQHLNNLGAWSSVALRQLCQATPKVCASYTQKLWMTP